MKSEHDIIDATPSKRIYRSIIADYGLNTAISELIDNVIDSRKRRKFKRKIKVIIQIGTDDQTILIRDDAGGIREEDLSKLISPGQSHSDGESPSIGIFGVGSKRAAVALARDIRISTRYSTEDTSFSVEYDDEWLKVETWLLPCYKIPDLAPNTTEILLSRLRLHISEEDCSKLHEHLCYTYAHFIKDEVIEITLNGATVNPLFFDKWAYPIGAEPREFTRRFKPEGHDLRILFKITSGVTYEQGSVGGNYGVYIYCNERLIVSASKAPEYGFQTGVAGVPHPRMSNARIIVELTGGAARLPWNSSKTGLNYNHEVFKAIREDIHTAVKNATALSKRLQPDFETSVEPYKAGTVICSNLRDDEHLKPSKLPEIPKARKTIQVTISELNKKVGIEKPWTVGAYESVIAVETIKKQHNLKQRNRILLIILDSTLEIAFKDYLAHEVTQPMGQGQLTALFNNRIDVNSRVKQTVLPNDDILWSKVDYFYKMRCELVHKRVTVGISDQDIDEYEKLTTKLLTEMYGLNFPGI
ncbi:ATP-binding protein [Cerasicoccus fimbriatus]|uniref:ATP-binding protein n=1 Tax=Cerasicoccus fimbriatus TaxID=3014554 RepID=UPI0022B35725|nr:ATP-binding protein [Cerasicoccus sp. TK19100]